MWNPKNKINEQGNPPRNRLTDIVNKLMSEKGEWSEKSQKSRRTVKSSIGYTVNNIVITMSGARWDLELSRRSVCKLSNH